jgi:D-proline reductase (dithiol) PrdB
VSLVARLLEEHGISTVILGSAIDIVEYCGVPRFIFTDFPLGNPCGKPYDKVTQYQIMDQALELLVNASTPRTTVQTPFTWSDNLDWKDNYMRVDDSNRQKLLGMGEHRRKAQTAVKEKHRP